MHQIKALLDSKLKLIDALFIDDCFERCVTLCFKEKKKKCGLRHMTFQVAIFLLVRDHF